MAKMIKTIIAVITSQPMVKQNNFIASFLSPSKYIKIGLPKIREAIIVADRTNKSRKAIIFKTLEVLPNILSILNINRATADT